MLEAPYLNLHRTVFSPFFESSLGLTTWEGILGEDRAHNVVYNTRVMQQTMLHIVISQNVPLGPDPALTTNEHTISMNCILTAGGCVMQWPF